VFFHFVEALIVRPVKAKVFRLAESVKVSKHRVALDDMYIKKTKK
jgi:hypothetical protein